MRRVLFWLATVLAATVAAGGATYAYVGYRETSGPTGAVRGYFDALQRGDASGALAFGDVPRGSRAFLTDEVLAEQLRVAPLTNVNVEAASEDANVASVRFSYDLGLSTGTRSFTGALRVLRSGDGWRLAATAVPVRLTVDQAVDRWSFAGTAAPRAATLLFPGALPIRFDTPLLQVDPTTASVRFGGPRHIDVRIEPTAAARTALVARVRQRLVACVHTARPAADCPLASPRDVPGSLRGRITSVHVSLRVTTEAAGPVAVAGSAQFAGRFRTLRYDNTVVSQRGRLALPVSALAYPVAPLTVRFTAGT